MRECKYDGVLDEWSQKVLSWVLQAQVGIVWTEVSLWALRSTSLA